MSTDLDKIKYYLQRAHDGQGGVVFNEIGAAVDGLAARLGEIERRARPESVLTLDDDETERIYARITAVEQQHKQGEHILDLFSRGVRGRFDVIERRLAVLEPNLPTDAGAHERRAFALQFLAACAYVALLAPLRERYEERHLTELTVIGGVLLSLAPAAWLARHEGATWRLYERWAARGFVTVAIPITLWQAALFVRRLRGEEA